MLTSREDRFANYRKAQQDSGPGQMSTYGVLQGRQSEAPTPTNTGYQTIRDRGSFMRRPEESQMRPSYGGDMNRYMGGFQQLQRPVMPAQSQQEPPMYRPSRMRERQMQPQNRMISFQGTPDEFINSRSGY